MIRSAGEELHALARSSRRGRSLALVAVLLSIVAAGMAFAIPLVATALLILLTLGAAQWRRPMVDAERVARHLDRVHRTLEESTTLLLVPPGGLSAVERIQRSRAEAAFDAIPRPIRLPRRSATTLWKLAAVLLLLSGARALAPNTVLVSSLLPGADRRADEIAPSLRRLTLTITPPAYLGGRTVESDGDADAPEGARLDFAVEVAHSGAAWIITTNGDSLPLRGAPVRESAERSMLYQVVMVRDTFRVTSAWHRVTVHPDRPPTLTVVRPEERTLLPVTRPWRVPVEILASDDHGITEARLLATITTGSGEGVKFREDTLSFTTRRARGNGLTLQAELDLAALGMGPGDELYLSAQAFDGRRPEPNEGRSATLFISITDTAQVTEGEFDGLAIDRMPDYFRSQRQIIIDTEKLLAERRHLSEMEFKRRSNDIGIDQQLLRLRYSEVAGGEESEASDPMSGREHAAAEPGDPNAAAVADPRARAQVDLTEGMGHSHDVAENATLLAMSTKELLQRALGEMWQAELQLRTYKPDSALPYEQRALEYLEAVRQAARTYVKRVGLEPPPLEPDRKRLTGDLAGATAPRRTSRQARLDSLPAIRAVLAGEQSRAALEAAGREVATLVIAEPGRHLGTLQAVRDVIDALVARTPCPACEARMRAGLLAALPEPPASAAGATPVSPVTDAYFERMRRP